MNNTKDELGDKEIKQLVEAYINVQKATKAFEQLKEKFTKDLIAGKYENKYGEIIKSLVVKNTFDKEAFIKAHPKINLEDYTKESSYEMVRIKSLK